MQDCPAGTNEAGAAPGCQGCEGQSLCSSTREEPRDEALTLRLGAIRHKVLVLAGKGGVGKSTVAVQLAGLLARRGRRVGLLDLDLCGPSLALMLGVQGAPVVAGPGGWTPVKPPGFEGRLSLVSIALLLAAGDAAVLWRGPRKHATILSFLRDVYWSKLDFLIVDTPPGTSDEHLTVVAALRAAMDGAVLVTTPSVVARATLGKELDFCRKLGVPVLGIVENMRGFACPCCGHLEEVFPGEAAAENDGVARLARERGVAYLGSVPLETAVGHAADEGQFVASPAMEAVLAQLLQVLPEDDDF